ncbi:MAG: hypothetical protein JXR22_14440 [Prolixibacteraceae bacterium]|nr:hypothetical protein [Prolixibacteraceae bacterium]
MKGVFIFLLFVVWLSACQRQRPQSTGSNTEALYEQISELMNQQQYDSVLIIYDQLILLDSNLWDPHFHKANLFIQQKELEKALEESELVIRKNPALAEGWYTAGVIHDWLGHAAKASEYYLRSLTLFEEKIELASHDNEVAGHRLNRAILLILMGKEADGQAEIAALYDAFPKLLPHEQKSIPLTRDELLLHLFNAIPE